MRLIPLDPPSEHPAIAALTAPRTAFSLADLRFDQAVQLGRTIRSLGDGVQCQQQAAERLVDYLYAALRNPQSAESDVALVRCFLTQRFEALPPAEQAAATSALGQVEVPGNLRCLTLLATRGDLPAWCSPHTSAAHHAIPLPDLAMVSRAPMISALFSQLGVAVEQLIGATAEDFLLDDGPRSFNVFHVEDAPGSALIPAQQTFVLAYGIRSVVGIGGLMPSGELFAVILFAKVRIRRDVAELFRTLALSVKLLFLAFPATQVFPGPSV